MRQDVYDDISSNSVDDTEDNGSIEAEIDNVIDLSNIQ